MRIRTAVAGLPAALRVLRQPRYIALSALMLIVALACIGAGTWQIVRFEDKVHANDELTANAHADPAPVASVLPLVGRPAPSEDAVRYRTVTATGRYQPQDQGLVRLRTVNSQVGFYVLTPLATDRGILLVVRGFVGERSDGSAPDSVAAPPAGPVHIRARAETGESKADITAGVPAGQLRSINPDDQAARLGRTVYNGYVQLLAGQPGTKGLTVLPPPDLSNPAGGALEPQHFAYIVQWYIFAMLAIAAPFAMARADRRERNRDAEASGEPEPTPDPAGPPESPPPPELSAQERRAAKLADRYGRPVQNSSDRGVS